MFTSGAKQGSLLLPSGATTAPEPRRNVYIRNDGTEFHIPRPYGAQAPFKSSETGSTMRVSGQLPEWTQSRKTQSQMDTIPNGHNPEWTQPRMDTIPNGHNPEWTQSRMDTIPNGHNPKWTPSRMDTIPNGHDPEWTRSRMSTYNYTVILVFYIAIAW